jgi:hypothetical protein
VPDFRLVRSLRWPLGACDSQNLVSQFDDKQAAGRLWDTYLPKSKFNYRTIYGGWDGSGKILPRTTERQNYGIISEIMDYCEVCGLLNYVCRGVRDEGWDW